MSELVRLTMFGWPILAVALIGLLEQRRAVLISFIGAWLFLPVAQFPFPGLPDYTKESAASFGVMVGTLLFARSRLLRLRIHWIDIPVIVFCLWPVTSSYTTGKGSWDAISAVIGQFIVWGMPYLFGRVYFNDLRSIRLLTNAMIVGGLIYVPLCLIEIRLSPQLHMWIYGYYQHSFEQTIRFGGFRPTVFMQHGLAVAMWMISTTLMALSVQSTRAIRQICGLSLHYIVPTMIMTCILCKSTGALVLLFVGVATCLLANLLQNTWPLIGLSACVPFWMVGRTFNWFNGQVISDLFANISSDRAGSFTARLIQEDEFLVSVFQHPICGGSRWVPNGADQLWLLCFWSFGAIGLAALTTVFLLPGVVILRRFRTEQLRQPELSPLIGMSVVLILHMMDNLANSMTNPIFTLIAGSLGSVVAENLAIETASMQVDVGQHSGVVAKRFLWPPRVTL